MIKKKRTLVSKLVIALSLMLLIGNTSAFANNYGDTSFSFHLNSTYPQYTIARQKMDTSKLYYKVVGGNTTVSLTSIATDKAGTSMVTYNKYTKHGVFRGTSGYLSSDAYEQGYKYVKIMFKLESAPGTISGLWSPDNYNKY